MKRIIFCFDGTTNVLNANTPTNVVLLAASIIRDAGKVNQIIHYDEGVGTRWYEKAVGTVLGEGLIENIRQAYAFLIFNYDPGDEIFVFGFSRGAYSAQTFVNFVRHVGPLRRLYAGRINEALDLYRQRLVGMSVSSDQMRNFRAIYSSQACVEPGEDAWRSTNISGYKSGSAPLLRVKYVGIWDSVGAMGIPAFIPFSSVLNKKYQFLDASMSEFIENARHAIAIDERRVSFPSSPWGDLTEFNRARKVDPDDPRAPYQERWFPGVHGSVGGGGDIRGLSDSALAFILTGAKLAGLQLDTTAGSRIHSVEPNALVPIINMTKPTTNPTYWLQKDRPGPEHVWQVSNIALHRWKASPQDLPQKKAYRPVTLRKVAQALDSIQLKGVPDTAEILTKYIVEPSDTLTGIAYKLYGHADLYRIIFDANRDIMDDPDDLYPGWTLRIPRPPSPAKDP